MILFGERYETGLDLFVSGSGVHIEGLVMVEKDGSMNQGSKGGELVKDHLNCYKEV